jgi:hypothetical protein
MHALQLAPVLPSAAQVEEHADEYVVHLEIRDGDAARVKATYSHGGLDLHIPRVARAHRFALNPDASGV